MVQCGEGEDRRRMFITGFRGGPEVLVVSELLGKHVAYSLDAGMDLLLDLFRWRWYRDG